jgi:hypothetical protein
MRFGIAQSDSGPIVLSRLREIGCSDSLTLRIRTDPRRGAGSAPRTPRARRLDRFPAVRLARRAVARSRAHDVRVRRHGAPRAPPGGDFPGFSLTSGGLSRRGQPSARCRPPATVARPLAEEHRGVRYPAELSSVRVRAQHDRADHASRCVAARLARARRDPDPQPANRFTLRSPRSRSAVFFPPRN